MVDFLQISSDSYTEIKEIYLQDKINSENSKKIRESWIFERILQSLIENEMISDLSNLCEEVFLLTLNESIILSKDNKKFLDIANAFNQSKVIEWVYQDLIEEFLEKLWLKDLVSNSITNAKTRQNIIKCKFDLTLKLSNLILFEHLDNGNMDIYWINY